jgi:hypothetical protein
MSISLLPMSLSICHQPLPNCSGIHNEKLEACCGKISMDVPLQINKAYLTCKCSTLNFYKMFYRIKHKDMPNS